MPDCRIAFHVIDKQMNRQTDRWTDRQTDGQTDSQMNRQKEFTITCTGGGFIKLKATKT